MRTTQSGYLWGKRILLEESGGGAQDTMGAGAEDPGKVPPWVWLRGRAFSNWLFKPNLRVVCILLCDIIHFEN